MAKKKKKPTPGNRHPLLMYKRTMDRVWGITILLGLVLFALWWFGGSFTRFFRPEIDTLILAGAIISTGIGLFAFFARFFGFVQAHGSYFVIATPFIRMKTSYKRVIQVRSAEFNRLYPPSELSWAQRTYLEPFFGQTAVVVNLKSYPFSQTVLRLFFPKQLFSPTSNGFILLVPKWMELSLELDSRISTWQQSHTRKPGHSIYSPGRFR